MSSGNKRKPWLQKKSGVKSKNRNSHKKNLYSSCVIIAYSLWRHRDHRINDTLFHWKEKFVDTRNIQGILNVSVSIIKHCFLIREWNNFTLFYNKLLLHSTSGSLLELEKWLQLCVSVCYSKHKHPRNRKRPIFELLENWFLRFSLILKVTSFGLQNNDQMSADILMATEVDPVWRLDLHPTDLSQMETLVLAIWTLWNQTCGMNF